MKLGMETGILRGSAAVLLTVMSMSLLGCRAAVRLAPCEESLVEVEYGGLNGIVQREFAVRSGEEGVVEVLFERNSGTAEIHLSRKGEEIAALSLPDADMEHGEPAMNTKTMESAKTVNKSGEPQITQTEEAESVKESVNKKQSGRIRTVLGCGTYIIQVKAENYGGNIRCSLTKRRDLEKH